jgi:hypothetical protein
MALRTPPPLVIITATVAPSAPSRSPAPSLSSGGIDQQPGDTHRDSHGKVRGNQLCRLFAWKGGD